MTTWAYRPRRRSHRRAIAIGLLIGLLVATGVAVAAWIIGGSGTGYVKAGSTVALTTNNIPPADLAGDLFPGGTVGLKISVNNGNAYPVTIQGVQLSTNTPGSDNPLACSGSFLLFPNGATFTGLSLGPIPANGTATVTVPAAVSLATDAPTACQGNRFFVVIDSMSAVGS